MSGSAPVDIFPALSGNNLVDQFGQTQPVNNQIAYYPVPTSLSSVAQNSWNLAQWGQSTPLMTANYVQNSAQAYDPLYGNAAYAWSNSGAQEALAVYNAGSTANPDYVYSMTDGSNPAEGDMFLQSAVAPSIPSSENNLGNIVNVSLDMKVTQANWTPNTALGVDIGIVVVFNGANGLPVSSGFIQIDPFSTRYGNGVSNAYENLPPTSDQGMPQLIYSNTLPGDPSLPIIPEDANAAPIALSYNVNKYAQNAFDQYFALLPSSQKSAYETLSNWSVVGFYVGNATYNLSGNGSVDQGSMTVQYSNIHLTVQPGALFNAAAPPASSETATGPMIGYQDISDTFVGPNGISGQVEGSTVAGAQGSTVDRYFYTGGDSVSLSASGNTPWDFGGGTGIDTLVGNSALDTMVGSTGGTVFDPKSLAKIDISSGAGSVFGTSTSNLIHIDNGGSALIDIGAAQASAVVSASQATIRAGYGGNMVLLNGSSDTASLSSDGSLLTAGDLITITGGGGTSAIADFGQHNTIEFGGGTIYEYGANASIAASGNSLINFNGTSNEVSVQGSEVTIQGGAVSSVVKIDHAFNTVDINGTGTVIDLQQYSGSDSITAFGADETINVSSETNTINASGFLAGSQVIAWHNSNLIEMGAGGSAILIGDQNTISGSHSVVADFGSGNTVSLTGGTDYEFGSNSSIVASGSALIDFNGSNNSLSLAGSASLVQGGAQNSTIYAAAGGADTIFASSGMTIENQGASIFLSNSGTGDVILEQGAGAVTAQGGAGSSTLYGGQSGANVLIGGTGSSNALFASGGNSTLQAAGAGSTTMVGGAGSNEFVAASGTEQMIGSTITGSSNEFLFGAMSQGVNASISNFGASSEIILAGGISISSQQIVSSHDVIRLSNGGTITLMDFISPAATASTANGITILR
jgi:hypothetical protein